MEPARRSMVSHFSGCHRRRQVRQLLRWAVAEGDAPPDGSLRVLDPGFATGTLRSGRVTHELTVHTVEQADRVDVLVGYPSARGAGHPLQALSVSPPERLRAVVDGLDGGDADHLAGWLAGGEGMGVGHWLLAQRPGGDVVVLVDGRDPGRRLVVTDERLAWRIFVGCFGRSVRARGEDPVCPGLVPPGITAADVAEHGMRINDVPCG